MDPNGAFFSEFEKGLARIAKTHTDIHTYRWSIVGAKLKNNVPWKAAIFAKSVGASDGCRLARSHERPHKMHMGTSPYIYASGVLHGISVP